jgi:phospholipid-translocating ATPase
LGKEAFDDIARWRRDAEANAEPFTILSFNVSNQRDPQGNGHLQDGLKGSVRPQELVKKSKVLKVGDILKIQKDQLLPAHVVILKNLSSNSSIQGSTASQVESSGPPANLLDGLNQAPSSAALADEDASGETFTRTDHLDGETDWSDCDRGNRVDSYQTQRT